MNFNFKNKTVLITGGARGIGLSIAKMYLTHGAEVIITYNESLNNAEELLNWSKEKSYKLKIFKLNLNDLENVYSFLKLINKEKIYNIDILINNSGIDDINPLIFQEDDKILSLINVNFSNSLILTKYILKDFMKENSRIINISSVWGNVGASCEVVYSSTKGAINLFTKSLSKEMKFKGIKIIGIAPGIIETDMNKHLETHEKNEIVKEIPLNRIGNVNDVVNAIKFFSSDYVNISGEIINIDGGWMM